MNPPFPTPLFELWRLTITDTVLVTAVLSLLMVIGGMAAARSRRGRNVVRPVYEVLERAVIDIAGERATSLVPLIVTLWIFIGAANLVGLVPGVQSPTRDLALTAALAVVSYFSGHVYAFKARGFGYLKQYVQPHPLLLPFNVLSELSRTVALALRLFGNMISGSLIAAIAVYLAGLLIPIPLLLLSVLTSLVQAYIFGVLTLVFTISSVDAVSPSPQTDGPK